MTTIRFQMLSRKIAIKVDPSAFTSEYAIYWIAVNDRVTIFVHPMLLEIENYPVLLEGLIHELFEIACWQVGIYDYETESFSGFGQRFYREAIGAVNLATIRAYKKLTTRPCTVLPFRLVKK